jgi:hypothetical protein
VPPMIPGTCCSTPTCMKSAITQESAACRSAQRRPRWRSVVSSAGRTSARELAVTLMLAVVVAGCSPEPADPGFKLRALRSAIVEYHARVGELPSTLEQTCALDSALCRLEPPDRWLRDSWGTLVRFESRGRSFRLTSAGPDRVASTADDLALDASEDSIRTARLAGCYVLAAPIAVLDARRIELTAQTVRSGGYAVRSPLLVHGDTAFLAEWYPIADDSLVARWIRIDRGIQLRARVREGTLDGRAASKPVTGRQVDCS